MKEIKSGVIKEQGYKMYVWIEKEAKTKVCKVTLILEKTEKNEVFILCFQGENLALFIDIFFKL